MIVRTDATTNHNNIFGSIRFKAMLVIVGLERSTIAVNLVINSYTRQEQKKNAKKSTKSKLQCLNA